MNLRICLLLILITPISSKATLKSGLLRLPDDWIPYVERVRVDEIILIEKQLDVPLSEKSDLAIYNCDEKGRIHVAYSLRNEDRGYRLEMSVLDGDAGGPSRRAILLPRDIAEKLIDGFELMLTKQVFLLASHDQNNAYQQNESSVIWVYLHPAKNATALGKVRVPVGRCWVGVPDSNRPFFDIIYKMRRCFEQRDAADPSPFTELDIAISNLRLSYPK